MRLPFIKYFIYDNNFDGMNNKDQLLFILFLLTNITSSYFSNIYQNLLHSYLLENEI